MDKDTETGKNLRIDSLKIKEFISSVLEDEHFRKLLHTKLLGKKKYFTTPTDLTTIVNLTPDEKELSRQISGMKDNIRDGNDHLPPYSKDYLNKVTHLDTNRILVESYFELAREFHEKYWRDRVLEKANRIKEDLEKEGFEVLVLDGVSLEEVIKSIKLRKPIKNFDLNKKINNNPLFRFLTVDNPEFSLNISEAFSVIDEDSNYLSPAAKKRGTEKVKDIANQYAIEVFDVIRKVQIETNITSFQQTADELNRRNITTQRGKKWLKTTIRDLNNRWKELGLISDPKNKPN